jgi:hypothetical protein
VSSVKSQIDSTKPSAPQYTLAGRELFGTHTNHNAKNEPGPGKFGKIVPQCLCERLLTTGVSIRGV